MRWCVASARTSLRQRELTVRSALGASRGPLVRTQCVESSIVAALGGIGALVAARGLSELLLGFVPLSPDVMTHIDPRLSMEALQQSLVWPRILTAASSFDVTMTSSMSLGFSSTQAALTIASRTSGDPDDAVRGVQASIRQADPNLSIVRAGAGPLLLARRHLAAQFVALVAGMLGALTWSLGMIGLYGVQSESLAGEHARQAVRLALGASAKQIGRMILLDGLEPVFQGLILGTRSPVVWARTVAVPNSSSLCVRLTSSSRCPSGSQYLAAASVIHHADSGREKLIRARTLTRISSNAHMRQTGPIG